MEVVVRHLALTLPAVQCALVSDLPSLLSEIMFLELDHFKLFLFYPHMIIFLFPIIMTELSAI